MFSVDSNNIISITRGDTASTSIYINKGTLVEPERYEMGSNDLVYIGVMELGSQFEDAIIRYKLTSDDLNSDGDVRWLIKSTDTEYLEPGKYLYEVKLSRDGGTYVDTVVSKTPFFIQD